MPDRPSGPLPVARPTNDDLLDPLKGRVLPDVADLGPPVPIRREAFRPDNELDQRVLMLASAVNDLRHAHWAGRQADLAVRKTPGLDGYDGAVAALQLWSVKLIGGTLHEMLEAIETAEKWGAQIAAGIVNPEHRRAWEQTLTLAKTKGRVEGTDRHFLDRTRNALAYHYQGDRERLSNGYRAAFLSGEETIFNQWGWMSTGNTLGSINFFFVDAALGKALAALSEPERPFERMTRLATTVAYGSTVFVASFLALREAELARNTQ
jgi:hypothetical protein